jgi:hypothetical protein
LSLLKVLSGSVKSRTGIIIFLAGCPLICWKAQLQSSVALSAFHIKHAGFSHSMMILNPIRVSLLETVEMLGLPVAIASTIHARVHEDNASAHLSANFQHMNNQNKHLGQSCIISGHMCSQASLR